LAERVKLKKPHKNKGKTIMQLIIIQITQNGSDLAILLNGEIILSADPSAGEDVGNVIDVATNISQCLQLPEAKVIDFSPKENWSWKDVIAQCIEDKSIVKVDDYSTTLLDTTIMDWRLTNADCAADVSESDKCHYAFKIEKHMPAEKVWFSIYNKAFDRHGKQIHPIGLHGSIEIRDGCPSISMGISPDQNVIHVTSNTSNELAVVPDSQSDKPTWMRVDSGGSKDVGFCFRVNDFDVLMEARTVLANERFEKYDFGERIVVDDDGWEINDELWEKTVYFESAGHGDSIKGEFRLRFNSGTHIIETTEIT
jgi:hypothetical protein